MSLPTAHISSVPELSVFECIIDCLSSEQSIIDTILYLGSTITENVSKLCEVMTNVSFRAVWSTPRIDPPFFVKVQKNNYHPGPGAKNALVDLEMTRKIKERIHALTQQLSLTSPICFNYSKGTQLKYMQKA